MGEEHFDFLSQPHRDRILLGFGNVAGDLTGVFVFFAGDGAQVGVGAAFCFRWTSLTGQLQCAVFGNTFAVGAAIRIGIVSSELFECLAFRTDVLVIIGVPFKIVARPGAVGARGFVQHRNVGIDFALNEPSKHGS